MTPASSASLIAAPIGGAIAGAIGAGVAKASDGHPILKGAIVAGSVEAAFTGLLVGITGMLDGIDTGKAAIVSGMVGAALGTTGAAVSEASRDYPVLNGALAGGAVAFLYAAANATMSDIKPLQTANNPTLSGHEMFP